MFEREGFDQWPGPVFRWFLVHNEMIVLVEIMAAFPPQDYCRDDVGHQIDIGIAHECKAGPGHVIDNINGTFGKYIGTLCRSPATYQIKIRWLEQIDKGRYPV